jgi:hypothetical protein
MFMPPKFKNSDIRLYTQFKVVSNPLRNRFMSPDEALYQRNAFKIHALVSSLTAQISKSCSLQ